MWGAFHLRYSNLSTKFPHMTSTSPDSVAIGSAVRGAIATAGLKQTDAAELIDLSINTFNRKVNGQIAFTFPDLVKVAEITGTDVRDLVETAIRLTKRGAA